MKRFLLLAMALVLISVPVWSAEIIHVKVNGMVCDFCAQSVLKVFERNEGVETIDIDLDSGFVTLTMKDGGSISDEEIKKNIDYSGYGFVSIERETTQE
jgi:copper chaperone CopZ